MTFEAMVEAEFAAAHQRVGAQGPIEPVHGHNFLVQVFATTTDLGQGNISVDFCHLKAKLAEVTARWDHQDLNSLAELGGQSPSAEYLARYLYQHLRQSIPQVSKVTVFENRDIGVSYWE